MDRYEKYKDSGVQWLGEIPAHWEVQRLKRCCELIREKTTNHQSEKISLENIEGWTGKYISTESIYDCSGVSFQKDDVLFGKLRPYLAKVYLTVREGEALGDFWVLRCFSIYLPKYLRYLLISKPIIDLIDSTTYGAKMPRADWSDNSKMFVPIPTFFEQTAIVSYLDSITARIDEAIALQQRMIDLLNERKQIIIHNAVTKGLNPDVKMKDSRVEMIGEIPEGWKIMRLKNICSITDGTHFSPSTTSEGKKYVTVTNVHDDIVDVESANCISLDDFDTLVKQGCQPQVGDILLAKDGTVGRTAIVVNNDFVALSSLGILHPNCRCTSIFLKWMLDSNWLQEQMKQLMAGSALKRITIVKISNLQVIVPTIVEQSKIATYIGQQIKPINDEISSIMNIMSLLRERKQIIINDVVTGKVKVS